MTEETHNYNEIFYRRGNPRPGCCWFKGEDGLELALGWDGNNSTNISIIETTEIESSIYFMEKGLGYVLSNIGFGYFDHNQRIEVYNEDDLLELIDEYGPLKKVV